MNFNTKCTCVLCLLILVSVSSFVFASELQLPSARGYVNDFANVIDAGDEARIEALCRQIENETTVEIAVVTVETVEPTYIEDYAVKLFEKWGIGKEKEDNGLLILVAVKEREIRFEVGYGLEPYITDGEASIIISKTIAPYFKSASYGSGIYAGVSEVQALLKEEEYTPGVLPKKKDNVDAVKCVFALIVFLVPIALIFLLLKHGKWSGGGGYYRGGRIGRGGFGGSHGGGGFGGFGGGMSGGGGATGKW
ncbi:MAG: TPM domain-containing protein [Candidatus Micrarchaeota archaeon]